MKDNFFLNTKYIYIEIDKRKGQRLEQYVQATRVINKQHSTKPPQRWNTTNPQAGLKAHPRKTQI